MRRSGIGTAVEIAARHGRHGAGGGGWRAVCMECVARQPRGLRQAACAACGCGAHSGATVPIVYPACLHAPKQRRLVQIQMLGLWLLRGGVRRRAAASGICSQMVALASLPLLASAQLRDVRPSEIHNPVARLTGYKLLLKRLLGCREGSCRTLLKNPKIPAHTRSPHVVTLQVTPLRRLPDMPVVDYDPVTCRSCPGVLSPYARVDFQSLVWMCPLWCASDCISALLPLGRLAPSKIAPSGTLRIAEGLHCYPARLPSEVNSHHAHRHPHCHLHMSLACVTSHCMRVPQDKNHETRVSSATTAGHITGSSSVCLPNHCCNRRRLSVARADHCQRK